MPCDFWAKNHTKAAPRSILTVPPDPLENDTFWPLFVHFFFCAEGEMSLLTMFLSYFLHSPLALKKSIFLSFLRKSLTFVNKSGQTHLRCSIVFNVCVTHAMIIFMQRLLCRLVKSIWHICDARGFLKFVRHALCPFLWIRIVPVNCLARRIFNTRLFLMLSTLSMTSVALDRFIRSDRHPHSVRLHA